MSLTRCYKPQADGSDLLPIFINERGELLLYGTITWDDGCVSDCYRITLNNTFSEKDIYIRINNETRFCITNMSKGECCVYVLARVKSDECIADLVCQMDILSATDDEIDNSTKFTLLQWVISLDETQRLNLLAQTKGRRFKSCTSGVTKTTGIKNLSKKYQLIKNTFSPQQQSDIEAMFEQCNSSVVSGTVKQKAELRLQYILNISTTSDVECHLTKSEIIRELDKHLYKMETVKEEIAEAIIATKYSDKKGLIIALVGNPGVGKTAIAKAIAYVNRIPYGRISLGSASTLLDEIGLAYTYDGSDCGEPVRLWYKHGTTHILMVLDEFDKAVSAKDGNPQNAFTDMLSDDHIFKDAFLGTYIDSRNTSVVLTMNSTKDIPEHLLNRCTIINVEDYSIMEKREIIKRHILPAALSQYHISSELVDFPDESIIYMLEHYTSDSGARESKRFTEKIIRSILSVWDERGTQSLTHITPCLIDSILGNFVNRKVSSNSHSRKIGF